MCQTKLLPQGFKDKIWHKKGYIFGAELSIKGYTMVLYDLDPISQLVRPEDVSEFCRVLGLFVQHKDRLPTWGDDSKPLHSLTRNSVKWDWSGKCESCFEKLRSQCLDNKTLAALNFTKQFRAATNASSDGKGVHIYQIKDPSKYALLEEDLDPSNRDTIMYGPRAWSDSMFGNPPYYQDADALVTGLTVVKPYGEASPLITLGAQTNTAQFKMHQNRH
jgi:hypothetical protein